MESVRRTAVWPDVESYQEMHLSSIWTVVAGAMPWQYTKILAISPNINVEDGDDCKCMSEKANVCKVPRMGRIWAELKMDTSKTNPPLLVLLARSGVWHWSDPPYVRQIAHWSRLR